MSSTLSAAGHYSTPSPAGTSPGILDFDQKQNQHVPSPGIKKYKSAESAIKALIAEGKVFPYRQTPEIKSGRHGRFDHLELKVHKNVDEGEYLRWGENSIILN